LPEYVGTSTLGYMPYVIDGRTFKVQFTNIAAVGAVPSTRVIATGGGLEGGGDLSQNRTLSIIPHGVGFSQLDFTGVAAGTYGGADTIPTVTVDTTGRVTAIANTPVVLANYVPSSRTVSAGAGLTGGGQLNSNITLALNPSNATPQPLGAASAGIGLLAAREDHVHPAVDLTDTTETQGVLPLGRGGTGDALSPVVGAVIYADNDSLNQTTAGNAGQILTSAGGAGAPYWQTVTGTGTVTSVSVVTANGFAGTVGTPNTTPAITLTTTVSGVVKGTGTALTAASAGTDYVAPGAYTTSGLTLASGRLLGRTTASTGAAEEITVGTGLTLATGSLVNAAPDQTVVLTAGTNISITGAYPSFTINATDQFVGTVTSVGLSGGTTGITATSDTTNPITSSGTFTLGGTLVAANGGTGFTSYTDGQLLIGNSTGNTLAKATLTAGTNVSITNGAGAITINATDQFVGTVTSVGLSGGTTGLTATSDTTNPITTSGTFTIGGTLAVANGGTNSTSTATAGGVAYGTGTAIVVNAAGPAGYVLTSGGAAPPVWTPVASLATSSQAYWGSFWDTTTQTAPLANTAYMLTLNTADPMNNGVTIVSGSRVTFTHAGVYSLTFSVQFVNNDNANAAHDANIWLRKNDSGSSGDIPDTDSRFTVPPKHAGVKGSLIGTVNFVLTLAAGDFIELVYAVSDVSVTVASTPAGTTPVSPRIPSIIFTAVAAAPVGLGYAGVVSATSMTIGTGSKTFTVNTDATDTAFVIGNRVRIIYNATNYMDGVITAYSGTSMTVLVDATAGSGTYTVWELSLTGSVGGVTSFSGNSTGLTPSTPTAGAISLAGTLVAANGGTGQSSYAVGDLLYASTTTALSKLADVATGNALISGGVGVAPAYGKIGLTTHVSGTLPVANGGTNGTATPTAGGAAYGTGTAYAFTTAGTAGQVLVSTGATAPAFGGIDGGTF
jgi:hypothetical protein